MTGGKIDAKSGMTGRKVKERKMEREEREYQQRMDALAESQEVKNEVGAKDKREAASPEPPKEEGDALLPGNAGGKWVNRNGSQKERMRRKWVIAEAEKNGQDPELAGKAGCHWAEQDETTPVKAGGQEDCA